MNDSLRRHKNCHGSEIEIFNSGQVGKYAFVLTRRNGDKFASTEDLDERRVQELVELFDRNEIEMLKRFDPDKYVSASIDWPLIVLCGFLYMSSLYLSGFDWKLAIMMIIPVVIILRKPNKRK